MIPAAWTILHQDFGIEDEMLSGKYPVSFCGYGHCMEDNVAQCYNVIKLYLIDVLYQAVMMSIPPNTSYIEEQSMLWRPS